MPVQALDRAAIVTLGIEKLVATDRRLIDGRRLGLLCNPSSVDRMYRHSADVLHRIGAVNGWDLLAGEWWRLLTSGLVHVGGLHLAVNMFALESIGSVAEGLWGRWRFAGLYLLAGLGGACCAMALQPIPGMAGASGSKK